jgi:hypothetical protein
VSAHSNSRRARLPCELRLFGPIRKKMPNLGALRALLSALWGATKEDLPVVTTRCRGLPLARALLLSCHSCHHTVWVAGWPEGWQTDYGAFKSPVAALRLSEAFQPATAPSTGISDGHHAFRSDVDGSHLHARGRPTPIASTHAHSNRFPHAPSLPFDSSSRWSDFMA